MTETMILLVGIVCFGLTMLGLALTVFEFKKISRVRHRPSAQELRDAPYEPHGRRYAARPH